MQQASHAAENILRTIDGVERQPFVYRDLGILATIGRNSAVGDLGWIRLRGRLAWLFWLFVHIWQLIGFRDRFAVMAQWAYSYVTYQRAHRLITRDAADEERHGA
jgi:NADH dehydrogenase